MSLLDTAPAERLFYLDQKSLLELGNGVCDLDGLEKY